MTMRFYIVLMASSCLWTVHAFAPAVGRVTSRAAFALNVFDGADSLMEKVGGVAAVVKAAPAPEEAAPAAAAVVEQVATAASSGGLSMPDMGGDLPIPLIVGGLAAVAAAAILLGGGGEKGETAATVPTAAPAATTNGDDVVGGGEKEETAAAVPAAAPAAVTNVDDDVSIPYNAAAMLAYEAAGKPDDFASFESKYLADAVAEVIAKKQARESS